MDEEQTGTYTLHSGGVERFDTRNIHEMINYLLELLRSESAAFAGYGYAALRPLPCRKMNQKMRYDGALKTSGIHACCPVWHY